MATVNLNEQNFESTTMQEGITIVDFWAPWCGPCRMFGPVFEASSEKHPDITFAKVNTQDEPGIAGALEIRSIPTLMIIRDGVLLFRQPGALPASALEDLIRQVKELDMNKVRAEIAEANARA